MDKLRSQSPEYALQLLVRQMSQSSPGADGIELYGLRWALTRYSRASEAPPFTCISYSWGRGRTRNVVAEAPEMSDRTIAAIEATHNASRSEASWAFALRRVPRDEAKEARARELAVAASRALWIDALCVPSEEPARTACLKRMGEIYATAWQVVVALAPSCAPVLARVRASEKLDLRALELLNMDEWCTRGWAYQEAVNGKRLYFVAQGDEGGPVAALDLLNAITPPEKESHGWARTYPNLQSLQTLIAEYRNAEAGERSACQVLATLHGRTLERPDVRFYAMVGAITPTLLESGNDESISAAEYFMRVCERKADFSFIYSVAHRDETPGRKWRPVAGPISPVLHELLVDGRTQSGKASATHLTLNDMCRMNRGAVRPDPKGVMIRLLEFANPGAPPPVDLEGALLDRLKEMGFSGCGERLEFEAGYFYPVSRLQCSDQIELFVSCKVSWWWGAMGLLVRSIGADIHEFCDVGLFVGRVPKTGVSINVP